MCNLCSEACNKKNIRDQITEGLQDGDIVEALLQENNLTLAIAISKYQVQLRSCQDTESRPIQPTVRVHLYTAVTLGAKDSSTNNTHIPRIWSRNSTSRLIPMPCTFSQTCFHCQEVGHCAKVCQSRAPKHNSCPTPIQALMTTPNVKHLTIFNIQSINMEKAPLIKVCITSANGSSELEVLPDSVADI